MRIIAIGLACGFILGCGKVADISEVKGDKSTVILVEDGFAYCGGVAIGPRMIVTAGHCIRMGMGYMDYGLGYWEISRAYKSKEHDIGVLISSATMPNWAEVREGGLENGEGVCMVYGGGWAYRESCGIVLDDAYNGAGIQEGRLYKLDIKATYGSSGSGVWDSSGKLSGICLGIELGANKALILGSSEVMGYVNLVF